MNFPLYKSLPAFSRIQRKQYLLIFFIFLYLTGCASPSELLDRQANFHGFTKKKLIGKQFTLISYANKPFCNDKKIHIYIHDDGTPWSSRNTIALDPNSSYSLLLDLMALDNTASQYIGRPCYLGQHTSKNCHPNYWTFWRYSPDVVDSMSYALLQQLAEFPDCEATLIGYSGGGALAMLLAPQLKQVQKVITIAGNLDIDAWTQLHEFTPLRGSLNPAYQPPLHKHIKQLHLIGTADSNIPPSIIKPVLQQQIQPNIIFYEQFTHECCWKNIWPSVINQRPLQNDDNF